MREIGETLGSRLLDYLHWQVPVTAPNPIRLEIIAVHGKHRACLEFFGSERRRIPANVSGRRGRRELTRIPGWERMIA